MIGNQSPFTRIPVVIVQKEDLDLDRMPTFCLCRALPGKDVNRFDEGSRVCRSRLPSVMPQQCDSRVDWESVDKLVETVIEGIPVLAAPVGKAKHGAGVVMERLLVDELSPLYLEEVEIQRSKVFSEIGG